MKGEDRLIVWFTRTKKKKGFLRMEYSLNKELPLLVGLQRSYAEDSLNYLVVAYLTQQVVNPRIVSNIFKLTDEWVGLDKYVDLPYTIKIPPRIHREFMALYGNLIGA